MSSNPPPVLATIRAEGRHIASGAFAPLATFAMFHMVTVFPLTYAFLYTKQAPAEFLMIETACAVLGVLAIVGSGVIADRIGRRMLLGGSACAIAAFSGFAPQLLAAGNIGEATYMSFGFILLGLSFGQSSGSIAFKYAKMYRYTATAIASDFAWLFGAGAAPYAALWLTSHFGLLASGLYLLSGAVATLLALYFSKRA